MNMHWNSLCFGVQCAGGWVTEKLQGARYVVILFFFLNRSLVCVYVAKVYVANGVKYNITSFPATWRIKENFIKIYFWTNTKNSPICEILRSQNWIIFVRSFCILFLCYVSRIHLCVHRLHSENHLPIENMQNNDPPKTEFSLWVNSFHLYSEKKNEKKHPELHAAHNAFMYQYACVYIP